jgi:predicted transcriptional regulator
MARKNLSTRIENDLQKEIKKLAIDLERPLNNLFEEAIQDLLRSMKNSIPRKYNQISAPDLFKSLHFPMPYSALP